MVLSICDTCSSSAPPALLGQIRDDARLGRLACVSQQHADATDHGGLVHRQLVVQVGGYHAPVLQQQDLGWDHRMMGTTLEMTVLYVAQHTRVFGRWYDAWVEGAGERLACQRHDGKSKDKGKHPWWHCIVLQQDYATCCYRYDPACNDCVVGQMCAC